MWRPPATHLQRGPCEEQAPGRPQAAQLAAQLAVLACKGCVAKHARDFSPTDEGAIMAAGVSMMAPAMASAPLGDNRATCGFKNLTTEVSYC